MEVDEKSTFAAKVRQAALALEAQGNLVIERDRFNQHVRYGLTEKGREEARRVKRSDD